MPGLPIQGIPLQSLKMRSLSRIEQPNVVLDANGFLVLEVHPGTCVYSFTVENTDTAASHSFTFLRQFLDYAGIVITERSSSYTVSAASTYTVSYIDTYIAHQRVLLIDPNNTGFLVVRNVRVSCAEFI